MRTPEFWKSRGAMAMLLAPLGMLYGLRVAYKARTTRSYKCAVPVICVGNLTAGGQDSRVAAAMYAGIFELMGLAFSFVFEWMLRHDECLRDPLPATAKNSARLRFYIGQIPYLIAIGLAFLSAWVSLAIVGVVAVYYIFERTMPIPSVPRRSAR